METAAGGVHTDCWWCERVVGWENESAPVLAAFIGGLGWAGEDIVPFENVGFAWMGGDVWRWAGREGGVFAGQAFVGGASGHVFNLWSVVCRRG